MGVLKQFETLSAFEILSELSPLDFGGKYPVYGSPLKERSDICSSRRAAGFQMPAIDCAETISGAEYARIDAVEILMWDTDAIVDQGATEQMLPLRGVEQMISLVFTGQGG
ncbi:MAG: hypothetical protein ABSG18_26920 [Steroidobacteraceae bacterium]